MQNSNEYVKQLEDTIVKFLKPLKNIPFKIAIKAVSGCKVIPFNRNDPKRSAIIERFD